MKKSELIAAIMNNEKKVSPKPDPWVTKFFDEMQQGLYSGMPVVMYGDRVDRQMQRLQMQQLINARKASKDDDKKIADCRAELNQLVPFKYTWASNTYLSTGSTARISHMLPQDNTNKIDIPLEKLVETCDTYIPEPLRNADGTPFYVDTSMSENKASTSNDSAYVSGIGMFAQKTDQQQDSSKMDSLMYGDSSFSNAAGATK